MPPPAQPHLVMDSDALTRLCDDLARLGRFAFDTEFVAEESHRPVVCLLQVATGDRVALIDPLAGLDVRPFWGLVSDPAIEKVVHAGAEDLALCWHATGRPAANVFDLQIAAGFVGMDYPMSLANLVRACLGARLHKAQTLTDWRTRPLDGAQIDYAVEDVIHLGAVHAKLAARLDAAGRRAWSREECDALCAPPVTTDVEQKLRRLKGAGSLSRRELAIADALLDERERLSQEYDRPIRAVLKDHLLVEIARRGWTDIRKLRTLRGLNLRDQALQRLAAAVERARQLSEEELPALNTEQDSPDEVMLIALVTAVLRSWAARIGVAFGLLANKQAIRTIVRQAIHAGLPGDGSPAHGPAQSSTDRATAGAPETGRLTRGWRAEALGDLLDRVLSGGAAVRVLLQGGRCEMVVE